MELLVHKMPFIHQCIFVQISLSGTINIEQFLHRYKEHLNGQPLRVGQLFHPIFVDCLI